MKILIFLLGFTSFFIADYEEPEKDIPIFITVDYQAVAELTKDFILFEDTNRLVIYQANIIETYIGHRYTMDCYFVGFT